MLYKCGPQKKYQDQAKTVSKAIKPAKAKYMTLRVCQMQQKTYKTYKI